MKENLKVYITDDSLDMIHAMKEELRKHSVYRKRKQWRAGIARIAWKAN